MRAHLEKVTPDNNQPSGRFPNRNPIDKYTTGQMPPIQDASPTSVFDLIDLDCISEWESIQGEKLLAIPFDNAARNRELHGVIAERILTAVAEITKAQEVDVSAPRPSEEASKARRSPTSFLVHGLQKDQGDLLLQRRVWSSQAITFRITRFAPTCPNFLFAIKGLTTITLRNVYPVVRQSWDNEPTQAFISTLVNAVPMAQRGNVDKEVRHFLDSMHIIRLDTKEAGNHLTPRFNIYADSSKMTFDEVWTRLRTFLANCSYTTTTLGHGTTEQIPFRCTLCHSVDHPRGLCPFPDLPDWNGPKREMSGDQARRRNGRARELDAWAQRPQPRSF